MAASPSIADRVSTLSLDERAAWIDQLDEDLLIEVARRDWWYIARPEQLAPDDPEWAIWLVLAGRGWGKTRGGSEWLVQQMLDHPYDIDGHPTEWLVVAETLQDCRRINAQGPSGMVNVLRRRHIAHEYVRWPTPEIRLAQGQIVHMRGADPDVGRGLNLAGAWLDELAKWDHPLEAWTEGIAPSLRTRTPGAHKPRVIVTTTPKPIKLLFDWTSRTDGSVHLVRGSTFDNAANLSSSAIEEFKRLYGNSRIGRQELFAELLSDVEGALWSSRWLEENRYAVRDAKGRLVLPACSKIVVSIDPAVSVSEHSDETGIVGVGLGTDGEEYVLADRSAKVVGFDAARRAWQLWLDLEADLMVYEDNQGQDWVRDILIDAWAKMRTEGKVSGDAPLKSVRAMRGKRLRAEPVAARYEQGRVHHVGRFIKLEAQMTEWEPESGTSPDRLDALVHGLTALRGPETTHARVVNPNRTAAGEVERMSAQLAGLAAQAANPASPASSIITPEANPLTQTRIRRR